MGLLQIRVRRILLYSISEHNMLKIWKHTPLKDTDYVHKQIRCRYIVIELLRLKIAFSFFLLPNK